MEVLLECKNITKHMINYSIRNVSFRVNRGEILGLVGVNGSGKTSLLRILLGSYRLDTSPEDGGEIVLDGLHFQRDKKEYRKKIAYVMADSLFGEGYTAEQIGKLFGPYYDGFDPVRYRENLDRFGVPSNRAIRNMSKGQEMRLQLAFAVSYDAELYLMDEPCGYLDPEFREIFYNELRVLVADERKAVILSSHLVTELENIADRLVWMRKNRREGTVRCEGTVDEIRNRYRIVMGTADEIARIPADILVGKRIRENHSEALVQLGDGAAEELLPKELAEACRYADLQEIMYYVERGDEV